MNEKILPLRNGVGAIVINRNNKENTFVYMGERKTKKIKKIVKSGQSPFKKLSSISFK